MRSAILRITSRTKDLRDPGILFCKSHDVDIIKFHYQFPIVKIMKKGIKANKIKNFVFAGALKRVLVLAEVLLLVAW